LIDAPVALRSVSGRRYDAALVVSSFRALAPIPFDRDGLRGYLMNESSFIYRGVKREAEAQWQK